MLKYSFILAMWLFACANDAYAQTVAWPQVTELDKSNVYFACNVAKLTAVYLLADFELGPNENRRSLKSVDASEIESASQPDKGMRQFLDFAAGYEVTIDREVKPPLIKLEPKKELGFPVWHAWWELFPTSGGFSGVPFEYHTFIRRDGKRIEPRLYFCDFVYVKNRNCFSHLPIAAIKSSAGKEPIIAADKALEIAKQAISHPNVPEDVRKSLVLKQIILQELPFAKEMWGKETSVFELQFQERDNIDRLLDRKPLYVWVTIDGTCSKITLDGWAVEN